MESWELEQLRRSVAMVGDGNPGWALTKPRAEELIEELARATDQNERYGEAVTELRRILDALDRDTAERIRRPSSA